MEAQLPETEAAVTDGRPFKMMDVLGLIGMGLLTGGVVIYRRTVSGKRNIKGMPRK